MNARHCIHNTTSASPPEVERCKTVYRREKKDQAVTLQSRQSHLSCCHIQSARSFLKPFLLPNKMIRSFLKERPSLRSPPTTIIAVIESTERPPARRQSTGIGEQRVIFAGTVEVLTSRLRTRKHLCVSCLRASAGGETFSIRRRKRPQTKHATPSLLFSLSQEREDAVCLVIQERTVWNTLPSPGRMRRDEMRERERECE